MKAASLFCLALFAGCVEESPAPEPTPATTEATWRYEDLTEEERAIVDHEREEAPKWKGVHDAFSAAVRESIKTSTASKEQRR